jgi:hypothetical protein
MEKDMVILVFSAPVGTQSQDRESNPESREYNSEVLTT